MFVADIKRVVEQVSRDKGIDREVLISALEEALKSAARKKFGSRIDIEVQYSDETGEIEVFQFKDVVEEVEDPTLEVTLEEGRKLDAECEIGDSLGTKMDTSTFGRIAAQSAKQVIIQKMKDAEKDAVYANFIDRKGEIINGIVQRMDRGDIIVNLGHTEGALPVREQVPREGYRRGDRIRAYIMDVLHESRGPQIILSRAHPEFLILLFKTEVPEISEGIVSIMGAAREAGVRAKIAVSSNNSDIDPVGACVGMKGSRVQNVVQELRGEKIDIIPWHVDAAKYVCNALAPAEISRVIIDETNRAMEVIVPDDFLSIAIGKRGQNVRLASRLTGWHLDVQSETKYNETMRSGYESIVALPDVGVSLADALYEKGFFSTEEISIASVEDLMQVRDMTEEGAEELIAVARQAILEAEAQAAAENEAEGEPEESPSESAEATGDEADAAAAENEDPIEAEAATVEADVADDSDASEAPPANDGEANGAEAPGDAAGIAESEEDEDSVEAETAAVEADMTDDSVASEAPPADDKASGADDAQR